MGSLGSPGDGFLLVVQVVPSEFLGVSAASRPCPVLRSLRTTSISSLRHDTASLDSSRCRVPQRRASSGVLRQASREQQPLGAGWPSTTLCHQPAPGWMHKVFLKNVPALWS